MGAKGRGGGWGWLFGRCLIVLRAMMILPNILIFNVQTMIIVCRFFIWKIQSEIEKGWSGKGDEFFLGLGGASGTSGGK